MALRKKLGGLGGGTRTPTLTYPFGSYSDYLASLFQAAEPGPRRPAVAPFVPMTSASIDPASPGYYQTPAVAATARAAAPAPAAVVTGTTNVPVTTAGTGTGGGSSNVSQPPTGDRWNGFAGQYAPGPGRDMLLDPGSPLLHDIITQGVHKGNYYANLEGDLQRYGDIAPRLYEALVGGNLGGTTQADDTIINWINQFVQNQSKVGGASPTAQQIMSQLLAGFSDKTSSLGAQIYDPSTGNPLDTNTQISNVMRYLPLVGEFSNKSAASAYYGNAQRLAKEYRDAVVHGTAKGTFVDYLKQHWMRG